jgi:hypothetical protein
VNNSKKKKKRKIINQQKISLLKLSRIKIKDIFREACNFSIMLYEIFLIELFRATIYILGINFFLIEKIR